MLEDCGGYEAGYDGLAEKNGGFYLMRLTRGDLLYRAQVPERLWTLIQRDGISLTGAPGRDSLGQHDYTWGAGWMYDVNGYYPGKGLSEWMLGDGDVLTPLTLAWGKDIDGFGATGGGYGVLSSYCYVWRDGQEIPLGHDWQETARVEPTETEDGYADYVCTKCAETRCDVLPKTGTVDPTVPTEPTNPTDPTDPTDPTEPADPTENENRGACSLKRMRNILILLLCAALLAGCGARSAPAKALEGCRALLGVREGFLEGRAAELAGSSIGDWLAMALSACGANESYDAYLAALERHVTERYAEQGTLDALMATEYSRTILTVSMLGGDPSAFGTRPDGTAIDLLNDGVWNFAASSARRASTA